MASQYSIEVLKIVVAQICQTIGWHSIQSTPLDIMVDILHRYIMELGTRSHNYAEHFGHTTPNLDEIGLAFRDAGIRVEDLSEYIQNVESVPFPHEVPKYPVPGESHLNFLKPGSREVLTRPVHVHEHLPPMYPEMAEDDNQQAGPLLSVDPVSASVAGASSPTSPKGGTFKRPGEPLEHHSAKRARLMLEEEGRPLREISSVMMTTSGFLSPAREGKLPEARTPTQPTDSLSRSSSPIGSPSSYPTVPPEVKGDKKGKKTVPKKVIDGIKKLEKDDKDVKKKDTKLKEVSKVEKSAPGDDTKVKKLVSMKEFAKLKALKSGAMKMMAQAGFTPGPSLSGLGKIPKINKLGGNKSPKGNKAIVKSPKIEKQNSGNLQVQQLKTSPVDKSVDGIIDGKLSSEPDKQKLNIFKKISKVKEEKTERTETYDSAPKDSRESSPGLIIDESESSIRRDTRMAQIDTCIDSVIKQSVDDVGAEVDVKPSVALSQVIVQDSFDYNLSPPVSPSPPKTPELPNFPRKADKLSEQKERKRKRERSKSRKEKGKITSPKKIKVDVSEESEVLLEKPKTPEVHDVRPPVFPFFTHFPAPGLIPPPIGLPFFPRFPHPMSKNLPHPAMPNMAMPPALFMHHRPDELPETQSVKPIIEKPPLPPPQTPPPALPPTPVTPTLSPPPPAPVVPVKVDVEKSSPLPPPTPPVAAVAVPQTTSPGKEKIGHVEKRQREHKKEKKEKDKTKKKKDKKEKLKGKERAEKKKIKEEKREKVKLKEKKEKKEKRKEKERDDKPEGSVPKITLRLGPSSPRPPTPDVQPPRKITIKPVVKVQDDSCDRYSESSSSKREPSPELARMSALITRPPKKPSSKGPRSESSSELLTSPSSMITSPLLSPSPTSMLVTTTTTSPVVPKVLRSPVKSFAKVKTKASPPSTTSKEDTKELLSFYHDNSGNKVWICPACSGQDDGSPMIGCDDCDAWYHWVCVGIQVPPDENEDWYCRVCIVKKQGHISDRSKKKRKKKLLAQ